MLRWAHSESWVQFWNHNKKRKQTHGFLPAFSTLVTLEWAELAGNEIWIQSCRSSAVCEQVWPPASFSASSNLPLPTSDGKTPPSLCCQHKGRYWVRLLTSVGTSASVDRPRTLSSSTEKMANTQYFSSSFSLFHCSYPLPTPTYSGVFPRAPK